VTIKQTRAINFMQRGCLSVENANGSLLEASLMTSDEPSSKKMQFAA